MKIHLPSIPEEGKSFSFHEGQAWVAALIRERFSEFCAPQARLHGEVQLFRTHNNVTLQGQMHLEMTPQCDRCGKKFSRALDISLHRHLAPIFENPDERREAGEEVELDEEDLEFSCYRNDEIDLAELIAEEVLLALPMGFHCREECRGLCPHCGADLNQGPCGCSEGLRESPFAVLKSLKFPSQSG